MMMENKENKINNNDNIIKITLALYCSVDYYVLLYTKNELFFSREKANSDLISTIKEKY